MEKNGKIQNEINRRIGKASECYHLAYHLKFVRNDNIERKYKITIFNM